MVVVKRDIFMIQKYEQFSAMTPQSLDQTTRLDVFPWHFDQGGQPFFDAGAQSLVLRFFQRPALAAQAHCIAQNTLESLRKCRPVLALVLVFRDFFHVAQQVSKAFLFAGADNRVVRTIKIRNQNSCKRFFEKFQHDRACATLIDNVVCRVFRRENPKPKCLAVHTPAGLVRVQNAEILGVAVILGRKEPYFHLIYNKQNNLSSRNLLQNQPYLPYFAPRKIR